MSDLKLGATRWAEILPGVTAEMIWQWKHRGLIEPDGLDERGRPVYLQLTIARAEAATAGPAGRL